MVELMVGGIEFDSAHIVSWHQKCGRLHGHTYQVEVTLRGELNERGMVFEFGEFKPLVKAFVDQVLDHKFLVFEGFVNPFDESRVSVTWGQNDLVLRKTEVVPMKTEATIEHIADFIARSLLVRLRHLENVHSLRVLVTEGVRKHAVVELEFGEERG